MKKLKEKTGITLIALVITIIVLLILAGVTIVTLTGDNGLLTKASDAKQANEEAEVLEKIKTEVAGSYNLEGKIDLNELKRNLKHLNIPDEDIIPTVKDEKETFPVVVKMNNYEYDILEDATVSKTPDFKTLESLYGKVVNGYTGYKATDVTEWKLLYVDEENRDAFIISSNTLTASSIPLVSKSGVEYTGSNDVARFKYGKEYNKTWIKKCLTESTVDNAKATAYLCDPNNWNDYITGKAKYAAGGPTLEILTASFNKEQLKNLTMSTAMYGYSSIIEGMEIGGLYNTGTTYWIASPNTLAPIECIVYARDGIVSGAYYWDVHTALRPVVCLPASAIEVVGEGENAVLNYK